MFDDYILDEVLNKIKDIVGIEKFDDIKILIDTDINFRMILLLKML